MSAYNRTMIIDPRPVAGALTCILFATLAFSQTKKDADDADQKELYNYVLTMDKVKKLAGATNAMQSYAKQHPELNDKDMGGDAKNLDQMVQKMQKYPPILTILKQNGLTPREYAVGFFTLMQASMAVGFKKSGTYKDYPPKMLQLVSKANLDFVEQHFDEIQKLTTPSEQKEEK